MTLLNLFKWLKGIVLYVDLPNAKSPSIKTSESQKVDVGRYELATVKLDVTQTAKAIFV